MQALAEEIMQVAHDGGTTDLALSQMAAAFHKHTQAPSAPSAPSAPAESVPIDTPCAMCHVWATSVADRSHSLVASMEAQHQQAGEKPHPHREKEMSTARATAQGATDLVTRLQHGPPLARSRPRTPDSALCTPESVELIQRRRGETGVRRVCQPFAGARSVQIRRGNRPRARTCQNDKIIIT